MLCSGKETSTELFKNLLNSKNIMTQADQLKIIKAGFTIIRADLFRMAIKTKKGSFEWRTLEKGFPSKAALDRRMKELLKDSHTIED